MAYKRGDPRPEHMEFQCSCGETWPGTAEGCAEAWTHMMEHKRKIGDGDAHQPIGLIDLDTGEILVKGFSAGGAQKKGLIDKNPHSVFQERKRGWQREEQRRRRQAAKTSGAAKGPAVSAVDHVAGMTDAQYEAEVERTLGEVAEGQEPETEEAAAPTAPATPVVTPTPASIPSPVKGTMPFLQITIPNILWPLYLIAVYAWGFPLTPEGFAAWLTTVVYRFYTEHPKECKFDRFIAAEAEKKGLVLNGQSD